jgi:ABC-type multidrug transport system fused ATPase/permease subunit
LARYARKVHWAYLVIRRRENILFGQPYDAKRYQRAIFNACLISDLEMLPNGDMTAIGEKGINLSGGQKQRVNIARALYFNADITLFDDPLSAVDAHVGKHLFEHAIKGALAGRTRILVTHALHFLPHVDHIITVDNGRIVEQGTYDELIARQGAFAALLAEFGNEEEEDKKEADGKEGKATDGTKSKKADKAKPKKDKLMQEEERATGAVGFKVYKQYLGAAKPAVGILLLLSLVLMQGATTLNAFTLVWWQENNFNQGTGFYLGLYAGLGVGVACFTFLMGALAAFVGFNVSNQLHRTAIIRIMHAPMSLFDTTPLGRIMNRFSKDMDTIDNTLNDSLRMALSTLSQIVGSVVLIAIIQHYFLIAVAAVSILYVDFARVYRYSAREIKRLDNILRSSLYAHFSESLSGLSTIRAYGESEKFIKTNEYHTDVENRAYFL